MDLKCGGLARLQTREDYVARIYDFRPGDTVRVSYLDKQNTEPGVPVRRTYEVEKAPDTDPRLTVFRTRVRMVPETSEQAERKLERLREKPTIPERVKLYKKQIIAEAPERSFDLPGRRLQEHQEELAGRQRTF